MTAVAAVRGSMTTDLSPREVGKIVRRLRKHHLRDVGDAWHREYLPKHFEFRAYSLYGYQKRKAGYEKKKAKRKGHRLPLVYNGDLQIAVMTRRKITSTSKGVRVQLKGPRHMYMYRKDQGQPDKAAELTKTRDDEALRLAVEYQKSVTKDIRRAKKRERIRT